MTNTGRSTRSTLALGQVKTSHSVASPPIYFTTPSFGPLTETAPCVFTQSTPGQSLPGLDSSDLTLLRKKQRQLASTTSLTLSYCSNDPCQQGALNSTLIFVQQDAGTAVCIDPAGWLLTCSHCISDTEGEWEAHKRKWLLYHDGTAVQAECCVWDLVRDLALLKVVTVESAEGKPGDVPRFSYVALAADTPSTWTPIFCIGQPGADDLESEVKRKTKYDLVEISEGKYCGMVKGADPQNNADIGSLKHNAWTYWGHSGAPLLRSDDGGLIGLHSSWDENTGMRHGIALVAIKEFLDEYMTTSHWAFIKQ